MKNLHTKLRRLKVGVYCLVQIDESQSLTKCPGHFFYSCPMSLILTQHHYGPMHDLLVLSFAICLHPVYDDWDLTPGCPLSYVCFPKVKFPSLNTGLPQTVSLWSVKSCHDFL